MSLRAAGTRAARLPAVPPAATPPDAEGEGSAPRHAERSAVWREMQPLYAPIAAELDEVDAILRHELRSEYPSVDELVRYGCLLGGKRLRPALLLLTAKALGDVRREHLVLAAVVEMIHTATLVHDDVLDEAQMRRKLATVNSRWDNKSSVLLGDYLFTHAFYLTSTLGGVFACRAIGKATNIVCEGELRQIGSRGDYRILESEYLSVIDAKTAELCACCCLLGAHFADADESLCQRMSAYGRDLGVGFQIADDLLDIIGDEQATGKSLGTDLAQRKPTLRLIHALDRAGPVERRRLLRLLEDPANLPRGELLDWLRRYDAVSYSQAKARFHADRARAAAASLPASEAREVLLALPEFAIMRSQ